jgi:hypothetical protein
LVLNVSGLPAVIGEMPYISFVCVSRPRHRQAGHQILPGPRRRPVSRS